jgi:hypothetical protein
MFAHDEFNELVSLLDTAKLARSLLNSKINVFLDKLTSLMMKIQFIISLRK